MNRDSSFADVLTVLFGVRVTSAEALRLTFYRAANNNCPAPPRSHIKVARAVYEEYRDLYQRSRTLEKALYEVLEDYEHELTTDEAKLLGHALPDEGVFRDELREYSEYLDHISLSPVVRADAAGHVILPIETARSLHNLMEYNCHMVSRVLANVFETDYMKHFSYLKQAGFPYAGKTALQQTIDVLQGMRRVKTQNAYHVQTGAHRENWPEFLAGSA